jgi:RimJ/RimL family protein N-acetyltransferase
MLGAHERYARLRNGTVAHLRDIRPSDASHLVDGFSRLSEASRYARFFVPIQELSPDLVRYLTQVDGKNHLAVVALTADEATSLGIARFVRDEKDPRSAEFAITIVDAAQGQGLGMVLLSLLTDAARELGIESFRAFVHSTNPKILGLLRKVGAERVGSDGVVAEYRWKV